MNNHKEIENKGDMGFNLIFSLSHIGNDWWKKKARTKKGVAKLPFEHEREQKKSKTTFGIGVVFFSVPQDNIERASNLKIRTYIHT